MTERELFESIWRKLARVELTQGQHLNVLVQLWQRMEKIMATLNDVKNLAQQNADLAKQVVVLIQTQGLDAAQVQAVADQLAATNAALAAVVPTAPPPPVA